MSEHTPGPWTVINTARGVPIVEGASLGNDGRIANCNTVRPKEENIANARLIAAAPELLAACKAAFQTFRPDGCSVLKPSTYQLVQTAIAKAEAPAAVPLAAAPVPVPLASEEEDAERFDGLS